MVKTIFYKHFINNAEKVWLNVASSRRVGKVISTRSYDYQALPERFNSRCKIYRYFRKYWSHNFPKIMMKNLQLTSFNGRLCAPVGDPPPLPVNVISIQVNNKVIRAVLYGDPEGNTTIIYKIIRNPLTRKYTITNRTGTKNDLRYSK